ncbi:MAG TPA: [LysW]-lysine hydrolase [Ktedonobacteraceae bacterium]|nr:[LysW]-lysine hydrolase [Ktedonobacteraceae bacterium]
MSTIIEREDRYTSGVYGKRPVALVRGSGALMWDEQEREYIDCVAGHGVANIGHGRSEIAAALSQQALRLITCSETTYNDVRSQLLARLAQVTPPGIEHFFLCNSGTEAVEGAFKFARLVTGRTGIVAALRGFHGRSMGALSATWEPHYRQPFAPLLPGVTHMRYNNLEAAEQAITEETAAVIIELVQGEGGVHVADAEYVHGLARLCRERGALLIVDEVQTGFGRTGRMFACEHYDLQPDILCIAKSLAGGMPMGAIGLGERVMASGRVTRGVHGSTFGGNPLACAASLATLAIIEREALPQHAAELGAYALERLRALQSPLIREVRGRGLLIGIELTRRSQSYLEQLCERGVLALPAGPNVLRLLPPLVITREQLDRVIAAIADVLNATQQQATETTLEANANHEHTSNGPIGTASSGGSALAILPEAQPAAAVAVSGDPEVALLYNMLTIPSYSGHEGALAHYLAEQAELLGLHAEVDAAGNFIACANQPGAETTQPPLVLLGHMDTVSGNVPVELRDGVLYGRGAVDAKGPLAAFLSATARVARLVAPSRPIVVVGAVEEEAATSRGARAVLDRYRPAACIIGEPSSSQAVTLGYKGRLLVHGCVERTSSHSAGPQQASGEVAAAFWQRVRTHADEWNVQYAHDSAFAALMPSLRSIHSAHDGLIDRTDFLVGYRLPPNYDGVALQAQLEQWAAEAEIALSFTGAEAAFQTTRNIPLARAFVAAIRTHGGQPTFKHKTGTSDMNIVAPLWGENIVAYGPGDSRLDHTPNEHIHIAEYKQAIAVLETVLSELAWQGDGRR